MEQFKFVENGLVINEKVPLKRIDFRGFCKFEGLGIVENPFENVEFIRFPASAEELDLKIPENIFKNLKYLDLSQCNKVTSVPWEYFALNSQLKVDLPSSIKSFYPTAFKDSKLESLKHKCKSLTLGVSCFENSKIDEVELETTYRPIVMDTDAFSNSKIKRIRLKTPENAGDSEIAAGCFRNCYSLEMVTLDCNLEVLPEETFSWCNGLKRVQLPKGLRVIEREAFNCCKELKLLVLPDSIEKVDEDAFSGCSENLKIRFHGREWKISDFLKLARKSVMSYYSLKELALGLPEALSDSEAFVNNFTVEGDCLMINEGVEVFEDELDGNAEVPIEAITKIVMPKTLRELKTRFNCFQNLKTVEVPADSKLETIGENCFENCENLEEFTFPKSIKVIKNYAFTNSGIKKVSIEAKYLVLGDQCFKDCHKLEQVVIRGVNQTHNFVFNIECFANCETLREVVLDCVSFDLPRFFLYRDKQLQSIELPKSLEIIHHCAFHGCISMKDLKLPDSVERILDVSLFDYTSPDLMIDYLGMVWDRETFYKLVDDYEQELVEYGFKSIDEDSKYSPVFDCTDVDRVELLEELLDKLPLTLGEFIQSINSEEFTTENNRSSGFEEPEETSLFD